MEEVYILVKHGGFSYADALIMPIVERRFFIDLMIQEAEKRREAQERAASKTRK